MMSQAKVFLWRLVADTLIVGAALASRLPYIDRLCPLCQEQHEMLVHLFFNCEQTQRVLFASSLGLTVDNPERPLSSWIFFILTNKAIENHTAFCAHLLWNLWKGRN